MRLNLTQHTATSMLKFLAQATLAAAIIGAPFFYYFIFVMTP